MRIHEIASSYPVRTNHPAERPRELIYNKVKEKFEKYSFWSAINYVSDYVSAPAEWPEILELITEHKTEIIKGMLESIKDPRYDSYSMHTLIDLVQQLHDVGITWPELNTIKASIKHDAKVRGFNI